MESWLLTLRVEEHPEASPWTPKPVTFHLHLALPQPAPPSAQLWEGVALPPVDKAEGPLGLCRAQPVCRVRLPGRPAPCFPGI